MSIIENTENLILEEDKNDDFSEIREVIKAAFRADEITHTESNEYPTYSRSIVVRLNGKIVSALNIYISDAIIRGERIPCGGIGAVVTLPEHQKKGYCQKAMYEAFKNMYRKGDAISILEPFKEEFYEQFGYAVAEEFIRHSFDVENIRPLKAFAANYQVRKINDIKEAENVLSIIKKMARFGSRVLPSVESIRTTIQNGNIFIFEKNKEPVGIISLGVVVFDPKFNPESFEVNQRGLHSGFATAFTETEVIPTMLAHAKQFCIEQGGTRIVLLGQQEFPVRDFMKNRKNIHARVSTGFMIRIINFRKFCSLIRIPIQAKHAVIIEIQDNQCPWNDGIFKLVPKKGRLIIEESRETPDLYVDGSVLSKIIAGLLPIESIRLLGEIQCLREVAGHLQAIFPQESFFVFDRI